KKRCCAPPLITERRAGDQRHASLSALRRIDLCRLVLARFLRTGFGLSLLFLCNPSEGLQPPLLSFSPGSGLRLFLLFLCSPLGLGLQPSFLFLSLLPGSVLLLRLPSGFGLHALLSQVVCY